MPKVRALGAAMLRGNANNFYIRCDNDLDDIDVYLLREDEYPHIHVSTDGPRATDNITYIGITFGHRNRGVNINIFMNKKYLQNMTQTAKDIREYCPRISSDRVENLTRYLHNFPFMEFHQ
ncbi:hypothetical protein [Vibrio proteolyticus]